MVHVHLIVLFNNGECKIYIFPLKPNPRQTKIQNVNILIQISLVHIKKHDKVIELENT